AYTSEPRPPAWTAPLSARRGSVHAPEVNKPEPDTAAQASSRKRVAAVLFLLLAAVILGCAFAAMRGGQAVAGDGPPRAEPDRSTVDLLLAADEKWLLTVNQTANTVALVNAATGKVADEAPCGERPS